MDIRVFGKCTEPKHTTTPMPSERAFLPFSNLLAMTPGLVPLTADEEAAEHFQHKFSEGKKKKKSQQQWT